MSFRLDRFLSIYLFHPLVKRKRLRSRKVPVLMYHSISDSKRMGVHPYFETATTPALFAAHLRYLRDNNYKAIKLEELPKVLPEFEPGVSEHVVITFDDGLLDFYATAVSILVENDFNSTVFLPAGLMGQRLGGQAMMSWENARELTAKGVFFGSHSMSHSMLTCLTAAELELEIRGSKKKIETELGIEINAFSYPYAFPEQDRLFVRGLKKLLVDSGYKMCVTTAIGRASGEAPWMFLKRIPVNDHDDLKFFKAKLEGGYDWLHLGQSLFKKFNRMTIGFK